MVVVCFLASEARPTNNARVGMSVFDNYKKEGSYKHLHPRSLRPPQGEKDTILFDESGREKRDYNLEQRLPPMGNQDKVTSSDESNREKRDYNLEQKRPPMGNHDKVTSSDESNHEK